MYTIVANQLHRYGKSIGTIEDYTAEASENCFGHADRLNMAEGEVQRLTGTLWAEKCKLVGGIYQEGYHGYKIWHLTDN